jgi:hypothetical protein
MAFCTAFCPRAFCTAFCPRVFLAKKNQDPRGLAKGRGSPKMIPGNPRPGGFLAKLRGLAWNAPEKLGVDRDGALKLL